MGGFTYLQDFTLPFGFRALGRAARIHADLIVAAAGRQLPGFFFSFPTASSSPGNAVRAEGRGAQTHNLFPTRVIRVLVEVEEAVRRGASQQQAVL